MPETSKKYLFTLAVTLSVAILISFAENYPPQPVFLESAVQAIAQAIVPERQVASIQGAGSGLVGHWTFDEGTGTTAADSSGSGISATLVNGATWATGKVGSKAVSLDGVNDSVDLSSPAVLELGNTNQFTVAAWINPRSLAGGGAVFAKGECTSAVARTAYCFYIYDFMNDRLQGRVSDGTNGMNVLGDEGTVRANEWQHVALVVNGSGKTMQIFRNGVAQMVSPAANFGTIWNPTDASLRNVRIGANYSGSANFFNGLIDDVRVYNRALSASEIAEIYTTTSAAAAVVPDPVVVQDPIQSPEPDTSGSSSSQTPDSGSAVANPVNGVCSATRNACITGSATDIRTTSSQYLWTCTGLHSGSPASCSENIVVASPSPGTQTIGAAEEATNPQSSPLPVTNINGLCSTTANTCVTGTLSNVYVSTNQYRWSCLGSGLGTTMTCSKTMPSASNITPTPAATANTTRTTTNTNTTVTNTVTTNTAVNASGGGSQPLSSSGRRNATYAGTQTRTGTGASNSYIGIPSSMIRYPSTSQYGTYSSSGSETYAGGEGDPYSENYLNENGEEITVSNLSLPEWIFQSLRSAGLIIWNGIRNTFEFIAG